MQTEPITIRVSPQAARAFRNATEAKQRKIRVLLEDTLVGGDNAEHDEGLKTVPFERIEHLLGVFEGPGDLSTNPKYMDGFGESSLR